VRDSLCGQAIASRQIGAAGLRREITIGESPAISRTAVMVWEPVSVKNSSPATKTPVITKSGILKSLDDAISLCEFAANSLQGAIIAIILPEMLDDALSGRKPSLKRPP
jgi:hypothetical protein